LLFQFGDQGFNSFHLSQIMWINSDFAEIQKEK